MLPIAFRRKRALAGRFVQHNLGKRKVVKKGDPSDSPPTIWQSLYPPASTHPEPSSGGIGFSLFCAAQSRAPHAGWLHVSKVGTRWCDRKCRTQSKHSRPSHVLLPALRLEKKGAIHTAGAGLA